MPQGDPPQDPDLADRLRHYRERAGLSRATLAAHVGRSPDWIKALENRHRGTRLAESTAALMRVAEILGVDLAELVGAGDVHHHAEHPLLTSVTNELRRWPLDLRGQTPLSATELRARVSEAWRSWHTSHRQRTAVAAVLPGLLRDIRISTALLDGPERRHALGEAVRIFALTHAFLSFQWRRVPWAMYKVADLSVGAAQAAGDPRVLAAAAWTESHVRRELGDYDTEPIEHAAALLDPEAGQEELALWGHLQLSVAMSLGLARRAGDALRHWDEAREAAEALEPRYTHPWLLFNAATVDMFGVFIRVLLAHPAEAIRLADRVNLARIPSWSRKAFLRVCLARAHLMQQDYLRAVLLLERAKAEAPEDFVVNPFVREALIGLQAAGAPGTVDRVARLLEHSEGRGGPGVRE